MARRAKSETSTDLVSEVAAIAFKDDVVSSAPVQTGDVTVIDESDYLKDRVLALVDGFAARCADGTTPQLSDVRALRAEIAALK